MSSKLTPIPDGLADRVASAFALGQDGTLSIRADGVWLLTFEDFHDPVPDGVVYTQVVELLERLEAAKQIPEGMLLAYLADQVMRLLPDQPLLRGGYLQ